MSRHVEAAVLGGRISCRNSRDTPVGAGLRHPRTQFPSNGRPGRTRDQSPDQSSPRCHFRCRRRCLRAAGTPAGRRHGTGRPRPCSEGRLLQTASRSGARGCCRDIGCASPASAHPHEQGRPLESSGQMPLAQSQWAPRGGSEKITPTARTTAVAAGDCTNSAMPTMGTAIKARPEAAFASFAGMGTGTAMSTRIIPRRSTADERSGWASRPW